MACCLMASSHHLNECYLKSHKPISPKYCIYVSVNQVSLGLDNGLLPVRYQAITWTNADLLSIAHLRTKFSENWIETENFSFIKMHLKMPSAKWRPFYPDRDKLKSPVARSVYSLWNCWLMSPNLTNESLSLVQAMAWCFQATSHTWANVDPPMAPYGVTRPHCIEGVPKSTTLF